MSQLKKMKKEEKNKGLARIQMEERFPHLKALGSSPKEEEFIFNLWLKCLKEDLSLVEDMERRLQERREKS